MRVIHKYVLDFGLGRTCTIQLPKFDYRTAKPEVLTIQQQRGELCLWATVDSSDGYYVNFRVDVVGTGHRAANYSKRSYISTVQMPNGDVWHFFGWFVKE